MRRLYIDEAGTSANETVAVVAGVLLDMDSSWRPIKARLSEIVDRYIPEKDRPGHILHAKDIFGGSKSYKKYKWPISTRMGILREILSITYDFNINVSIGWRHKDALARPVGKLTANEFCHVHAFQSCLLVSDQAMENRYSDEVASVYAEDCTHMRWALDRVLKNIREVGIVEDSYLFQRSITHIVDEVQFGDKKSSPILQLADACAFATARFINGLKGGEELFSALLGRPADFEREKFLFPFGGTMIGGVEGVPYASKNYIVPAINLRLKAQE